MYKIQLNLITNLPRSVWKQDSLSSIPFAKDNADYQQFKKDIANGAELQDSTGAVMTASQIQAFIATLP